MYVLRDYQQKAVDSIYDYLRERAGNPCVVIPTAGGKSAVIAALCRDAVINWDGRVLILAHVKELLQQTAEKLQAICPTVRVGTYSAGLKKRETEAPVIVAGIQSVHGKAAQLGRFDLVIVDETHLIGEEGRYRELIADLQVINPDLRVIGLTATPYRLSSGAICKPDGILQEICFEVSVKVLMNRGFLSKMVSKAGAAQADTSLLRIVRGEFDQEQTEGLFDSIAQAATEEILEKTVDRRSVLIFCQNVEHARRVSKIIRGAKRGLNALAREQLQPSQDLFGEIQDPFTAGVAADWLDDHGHPSKAVRHDLNGAFSVAEVYGDTPPAERAKILEDFKAGNLKYLVNVNVLTTGFDAPNIDCVVLLRATVSPGLYYQMVGRGFRICEGKENTLILDFGENVKRHGPVDCIKMRVDRKREDGGKECPECSSVMAANASVCLDCGYSWQAADAAARESRGHGATASEDDVVSGGPKVEAANVVATAYRIHTKKGADESAPKTLRAIYQVSMNDYVSEWICVEHATGSFTWRKAETWWGQRCHLPMPDTAAEACAIALQGWLAATESIAVKRTPGKDFPEITGYTLGHPPRSIAPCPGCGGECHQVIVPSEESRFAGRIVCGYCGHLYRYAVAEEIAAYGILDPGTESWRGEIRYRLDPENLPPEPIPFGDYEYPEGDVPF